MTRTESRVLMFILLTGLMLRLCWALHQPIAIDRLPDQQEYLSLAKNLLHDGSLHFFDARFQQDVWAYRMPGYPSFIAGCGGAIRSTRIVQSFIDISTILAAYLVARNLTGGVIAPFTALLLALNPFYIYFSGLILTETLFASLLIWAILFLVEGRWLIATFLLITACYLRPSGLLFIPILTALSFTNNNTPDSYRLRNAAIATVLTFVCFVPWAMRNHYLLGSFIFTTTNGGITAYDGFHLGATGASDQRFIADFPSLSSMNEVDRTRFFSQQAMDWIRKNPMEFPALSAKKILRGWSPVPLSAEFGKPLYRWISALYAVPFDLLCLVGLFSSRLSRSAKILLTTPAVVVTLLELLSVGSIRYRMPAEAPLAIVAAAGAADLIKRFGTTA